MSEFPKSRYNACLPADLYFWRDNNRLEADLVFEHEGRLQTVEIESGQTATVDYIRAWPKRFGSRMSPFGTCKSLHCRRPAAELRHTGKAP